MATIDERVLKMRFDNGDFMNKIKGTLSALDMFKKALNFKGASNSIQEVQNNANRVNFNGMANSLQQVSSGFNAMSAVAFGVFSRIGSMAAETGMKMAQSFAIQPITDGFQEYELKMGSIQTILANTQKHGTTLDDVSASLGELNEYADKTIYNFGDMTKNIGLFTNAGLKLEESTSMIKGFSNAAAASGTSAQGASHAAYQLSQGLSAGYLTAMDWMSLTNAGMGNKNMQTDLIAVADAMGTFSNGTETAESATTDFKNSLAEGKWLTKDVMQTYLQTMAGDMDRAALAAIGLDDKVIDSMLLNAKTGEEAATKVRTFSQLIDTLQEGVGSSWAETWELLFGDFNQATDLFTGIYEAIGPVIDRVGWARNQFLKLFDIFGGKKAIFEGIGNVFKFLGDVIKPAVDGFKSVGDGIVDSARKAANGAKAFLEFTRGLTVGSETASKISRTFAGVGAIFSIIGQVLGAVISLFFRLIGAASGATGGFLSITASIGDFLVKIDEALKNGTLLETIVDAVAGAFTRFGDRVSSAVSSFRNFLTGGQEGVGVLEMIKNAAGGVGDILGKAAEAVGNFFETLGSAFQSGKERMGGWDWSAIFGIGAGAAGGAGLYAIFKKVKDAFSGRGSIFDTIQDVFDSLKGTFDGVSGTFEAITGVFDNLGGVLSDMQNNLKADILLKIAIAVGILAASVTMLAGIPAGDLAKATAAIGALAAELTAAMFLLGMIKPYNMAMLGSIGSTMILMAGAILILSAAVKSLSELSLEELAKGLGGVAVGLGIMVGALHLMPNDGKFMASAAAMILMSVAVRSMAVAVERLGALDIVTLAKGLGGLAVALITIAGAMRLMPQGGGLLSTSAGLILVAVAIRMLVKPITELGALDITTLAKGLGSLALMLGMLTLSMRLMPQGPAMIATGIGLMAVAKAIQMLVEPIQTLSGMSWEGIAKGVGTVAASLLVIAGAIRLMPKNLPVIAAGLILAATGVRILSDSVLAMGSMSWEEMAKGLIGLGGSLVIMAGGLKLMTGAMSGAAALTLAAVALGLLTPVLVTLSQLSIGELFTALGALAGVFIVLGGASLLLAPAVPAMMAFAGALILISGAVMIAGAGMMLLASAISMLAGPASAGIAALGQLFGLIPMLLTQLAIGITEFLVTLAANGQQIVGAVSSLVMMFLQTMIANITTLIPQLVQLFTTIVLALINVITTLAPAIINAFVVVISNLLSAIRTLAPQFMDTFVVLVRTFLAAINQVAPDVISTIINLINMVLDALGNAVPGFATKGIDIIIGLINGIASKIGDVVAAAVNLILEFAEGISSQIPVVAARGIQMIHELADAIRNNGPALGEAGADLGLAIIEGIAGAIRNGVSTVISAAVSMASSALNAAKEKLGIKSPSREFYKVGDWSVQGLAKGIDKNSYKAENASEKMADRVSDSASGIFDPTVEKVDETTEYISASYSKMADDIESDSSRIADSIESNVNEPLGYALARNDKKSSMWDTDGLVGILNELGTLFKTLDESLTMLEMDKQSREDAVRERIESRLKLEEEAIGIEEQKIQLLEREAKLREDRGKLHESDDPHAARKLDLEARKIALDREKMVGREQDYAQQQRDYAKMEARANRTGFDITRGLNAGILRGIPGVNDSMINTANGMINQFKKTLGIKSPSRVMMGLGQYVIQGLRMGVQKNAAQVFDPIDGAINAVISKIRGIYDEISIAFAGGDWGFGTLADIFGDDVGLKIVNTAADIGEEYRKATSPISMFVENLKVARKEISEAFKGGDWGYGALAEMFGDDVGLKIVDISASLGEKYRDIDDTVRSIRSEFEDISDMSPVIKPVIDLEELRSELDEVRKMGTDAVFVTRSRALDTLRRTRVSAQANNSVDTLAKPVVFNQNNYSPKPLPVSDIYRNTRNQIGYIKRWEGFSS